MTNDLWQCQTCGAQFPHTRGDEDIARCSRCVEVEVLAARVRAIRAELEENRKTLAIVNADRRAVREERDALVAAVHELTAFAAAYLGKREAEHGGPPRDDEIVYAFNDVALTVGHLRSLLARAGAGGEEG